jgi:hypothetical protein
LRPMRVETAKWPLARPANGDVVEEKSRAGLAWRAQKAPRESTRRRGCHNVFENKVACREPPWARSVRRRFALGQTRVLCVHVDVNRSVARAVNDDVLPRDAIHDPTRDVLIRLGDLEPCSLVGLLHRHVSKGNVAYSVRVGVGPTRAPVQRWDSARSAHDDDTAVGPALAVHSLHENVGRGPVGANLGLAVRHCVGRNAVVAVVNPEVVKVNVVPCNIERVCVGGVVPPFAAGQVGFDAAVSNLNVTPTHGNVE